MSGDGGNEINKEDVAGDITMIDENVCHSVNGEGV